MHMCNKRITTRIYMKKWKNYLNISVECVYSGILSLKIWLIWLKMNCDQFIIAKEYFVMVCAGDCAVSVINLLSRFFLCVFVIRYDKWTQSQSTHLQLCWFGKMHFEWSLTTFILIKAIMLCFGLIRREIKKLWAYNVWILIIKSNWPQCVRLTFRNRVFYSYLCI